MTLEPITEYHASDNSYGFRPRRNAHQALNKCRSYITDGYKHAVDMDLEEFFDTVNQSKLIEVLSRTVKAGLTLANIVPYIENKLFLKVNREKTTTAYVSKNKLPRSSAAR